MARPTGEKVEIEFTAGVWTDVTADVRGSRVSVKYGRTTEFSDPAIAELSLELDDTAGNYTVRNTASAYYPNVQPRKRIRWSITAGPLFTGYIKGWPPRFDGRNRYVPIVATDRLDLLGRIQLVSVAKTAVRSLTPAVFVPLDDAAESRSIGTDAGESLLLGYLGVAGGKVTLGQSPGDELHWLEPFASFDGHPNGTVTDGCHYVRIPARWIGPTSVGIACAFKLDSSTTVTDHVLFATKNPALLSAVVYAGALQVLCGGSFVNVAVSSDTLHTLVVNIDGVSTMSVYLDGALVGTAAVATLGGSSDLLLAGPDGAGRWGGKFALGLAVVTGFDSTRAATYDAAVRTGLAGEKSGDRFARLLGYAGLNWATEGNVMAGVATMGPADLAGKSVADALKEVATTEGGGAVAYVQPDGKVAFLDRTYRNPGSPVMTIDAEADLDGGSFAPEYDEATVVNDVTATRPGGIPQRAIDTASVASLGVTTDSFEVPAADDAAALGLAQDRIARLAWPALRVPSLAVDMLTATTAGLYTALAALAIGARVRLSGITTTRSGSVVFPLAQLDEYVEGWQIESTADSFDLVMDVTAADAPARGIWDDATNGRWQADAGSMTLQSTITSSGTTVTVVTGGSSPTLSTAGGDYPLQIRIDEEVLTVSSAPASGSSPQTLTVTRGQGGTIAAAHTAGAQITLYPLSTWTL